MKKIALFLFTALSLFTVSCGDSDSSEDPITDPVVVPVIADNYKILSVTSEGNIFEIGNNTGNIQAKGHITNQSNLIQLATICNVGSKIYAFESSYIPSPNILLIYDKLTGQTTTHQIVLPTSLTSTMADPFITDVEYNGSELIAIVSENQPNINRPNNIISINLNNYQTTDLNINFFQNTLTSVELISDQLFISTGNKGLLKIDLTLKTVTELQDNGSKINGTRLAKIGTTKLGIMKMGIPQVVNGVKPFEYNLQTNVLTDKSAGEIFAVGNITGASLNYNNEFLNIVFNSQSQLGLLKINYETNTRSFVPLNYSILNANAIIVDIIP